MGRPNDAMLVWALHAPEDDGAVQAAAGNVQRVGGPGDAVHLENERESMMKMIKVMIMIMVKWLESHNVMKQFKR